MLFSHKQKQFLVYQSLKVIYKGFFDCCLVLYASEKSSRNHYVENRIRKFQLVHKLQRCFSSHYLFSCNDSLPSKINDLSYNYKVLPSSSLNSILKQRENIMQSYKLCFHCILCLFGEKAIFSMFICDVTTELMNIN